MYDLPVQLNQIGSSASLVLEFNHHVQVGTIWFPLWRVPGSLANHNAVPQSTTQLHCDWLNWLVRCGPERKPYGLYFSMQQNCFQTYRLVCSNKQKLTISKLKLDTTIYLSCDNLESYNNLISFFLLLPGKYHSRGIFFDVQSLPKKCTTNRNIQGSPKNQGRNPKD